MTASGMTTTTSVNEPIVGTPSSDSYKSQHDGAIGAHHHSNGDDGMECFAALERTEKPNHLHYLKNFR